MKSDLAIAREAVMAPIAAIAAAAGFLENELEPYGKYKAKLAEAAFARLENRPDGKLILVTAVNPTPAGEGKTTTAIGLADALASTGRKTMLALREPSLGPVFGIKGGAAGGGYAQVVPMEDINLHFTGDIHAVTAANNLLCALIDNHIHQGNELSINKDRVVFSRVLDMNDRALRSVTVGLGGPKNGVPRADSFMISVASEVMAILCLAADLKDLKKRLGRIIAAYTTDGKPVTAQMLHADGAMTVLLKDAIQPNLVQTLEKTPCLIHGGPFANIAHGCNSVRATRLALKAADYVVTEAGFGADLGAEKFMDIKCRLAGLKPDAVVLVVSVRALKYNGGVAKENLKTPDTAALVRGLPNLAAHVENMQRYGVPVVVAVNRFETDSDEELAAVREACRKMGAACEMSEVFAKGGAGGTALAEGIGEVLTTLPDAPKPVLLVAKPEISVSTKYVYEHLQLGEKTEHPDIDGMVQAVRDGDLAGIIDRMGNVLEGVTGAKYPVIGELKAFMEENGAVRAMMSGSGPTVFGIYPDRETAARAAAFLAERGTAKQIFVTSFH